MDGPRSGTWIIDLDGVVWLAQQAIPGSAEAVARLRQAGVGVLFATNNALPTTAELIAQLAAVDIPATADDLVTSAQAAASLLPAGSTAVVCAAGGVIEALGAAGVEVVPEGPADAVVVGLTRAFDFDLLATAVSAVHGGARLIGTNDDATFPTPGRLLPGAGALLAAVTTAAGVPAEVAGKPYEPVVALLARRAPQASLVVGDRPSTDGLLARRLGLPFALVRSGVSVAGADIGEMRPDCDVADLAAVTAHYLDT